MKLTLSGALYHNIRYRLSRLAVVLFVVILAVYIYLQVSIFMTQRQIDKQQAILDQKNQELEQLLTDTTFSKLETSRYLKDNLQQLPWSVHIPKVIGIVDSIQSISAGTGSTIQIADLKVSLDEISLR